MAQRIEFKRFEFATKEEMTAFTEADWLVKELNVVGALGWIPVQIVQVPLHLLEEAVCPEELIQYRFYACAYVAICYRHAQLVPS